MDEAIISVNGNVTDDMSNYIINDGVDYFNTIHNKINDMNNNNMSIKNNIETGISIHGDKYTPDQTEVSICGGNVGQYYEPIPDDFTFNQNNDVSISL